MQRGEEGKSCRPRPPSIIVTQDSRPLTPPPGCWPEPTLPAPLLAVDGEEGGDGEGDESVERAIEQEEGRGDAEYEHHYESEFEHEDESADPYQAEYDESDHPRSFLDSASYHHPQDDSTGSTRVDAPDQKYAGQGGGERAEVDELGEEGLWYHDLDLGFDADGDDEYEGYAHEVDDDEDDFGMENAAGGYEAGLDDFPLPSTHLPHIRVTAH
jgi:hypothetical protein